MICKNYCYVRLQYQDPQIVKLEQSYLFLYGVSRVGLSYDGEGVIATKTIWFVKSQIFFISPFIEIFC